MTIEIKRMWETGPLRQWSNERQPGGNWVSYTPSDSSRGFAGSYVCDDCRQPVVGVYRLKRGEKWLCRACYELARSVKAPKSKRKAAVTK